jgi:hypothetical protein
VSVGHQRTIATMANAACRMTLEPGDFVPEIYKFVFRLKPGTKFNLKAGTERIEIAVSDEMENLMG